MRLVLALVVVTSACNSSVGGGGGSSGNPGDGTDGGMSCLDSCVQGTVECSGAGLATCALAADGCLHWGAPVACSGTQTCALGFCADHGTWATQTSMLEPRVQFGLAATATNVYVAGGTSSSAGALAAMDVYTIATGAWTQGSPLPTASASLVLLAGPDGKIYAIGGYVPANTVATTVGNSPTTYSIDYTPSAVYTPAGAWASMPEPSTRLLEAGATGPDGKLYVIGGLVGSTLTATTSVEAYDTTAGSWTDVADIPTPRARLAAVTGPDGKIYALGGSSIAGLAINPLGEPLTTVERYTPATSSWESVASMTTARMDFAAAVGVDGRIYAIGGDMAAATFTGVASVATVEAYTPSTNTWEPVTSLPATLVNFQATAAASPGLLAIGGQADELDGMELATVQAYTP